MTAELGETPDGWTKANLGQVADIRKEATVPNEELESYYIGLEHIEPGNVKIKRWGSPKDVKSLKSKFYSGDVLYGKLRPYLDKAALAEFDGICSTDLLVLRTRSTAISPFLIYQLHLLDFINYATSTMEGANHPRTSWSSISRFTFALPPIEEQRKIASVLCIAEDSIQKTDDIITQTRQLKKGLAEQLLSRGIRHTSFKQTALGEIPAEWVVSNLRQVVSSYKNGIYKPSGFYGRGIPSLRMYNIENGEVHKDNARLLDVTQHELADYELKPGDILINRVNSIDLVGKAGIIPDDLGEATFESMNIRLRVNRDVCDPHYLAFFLNTALYLKQIRSTVKSAVAQASINQDDLNGIKVCLPSLLEQGQIASILSTVDQKLKKERSDKEQLSRLKKGLMNDLLTGKVRVKVA